MLQWGIYIMKLDYSFFNITESQTTITSPDYQYWLFISGSGTISDKDSTFLFNAHDMAEVPIGMPVHISCNTPATIGCVTLSDFFITNTHLSFIPAANTELIRKVFFFAIDMVGIHHPHKSAMMPSVNHLMLEVLMSSNLRNTDINPAVSSVLEDINEHFTDCTYDISPAIEQTGYSKNHFRKLFHDAVGCSPIDFINNRRIEFAKRLLWEKQGNISIKDAALQSGFTDAYYFSRLFKKRENISPSEYQKKVIQTTSVSLQKQ